MSRTARQIRQDFLDFFRDKQHAIVPGSPVVPYDDPTLLFTNAGMNQFKDVFLGTGTRTYSRAADTQPCIRAGGKHNDLDDVGRDTYHHTFFEMLGNWSFGDYFKRDAIAWAWELLTDVWGLDKSRLHATYFGGDEKQGLAPDLEARDLWAEITGLPADHIHPGNMKDNFWEMGESGPCGPCSELHIDLTPDKSGKHLVNAGDARVMEIWNLVFIQFNRAPSGELSPLPARHVDTGMGFERVTALLQGKTSNYDTDIFTPLFAAIRDVTGAPAYTATLPTGRDLAANHQQMVDICYRVLADHVRCLTFAINDGCLPDREGRGYVLRRILRRAVRYGWQYLDMKEPFLHRLVPAVVESLGEAFPQLKQDPAQVASVIREEEASFQRTLERGIALFDEAVARAADHHGEIQGDDAFKLHDTYGFPIDLTEIMATERGLRVDIGEYERLMEDARERARGGGRSAAGGLPFLPADAEQRLGPTDDRPKYDHDQLTARLQAILLPQGDSPASILSESGSVTPGTRAGLVFDQTCFYGEQGGQIGDLGVVGGRGIRFDVEDTQRVGRSVVHLGTLVQGELNIGESYELTVDAHRTQIRQNHTATHILNWALREALGEHVQQKGSLVDAEKTRFDFSHPQALTDEQLAHIESLCAEQIAARHPVHALDVPQTDALRINGLRAVFGEKYPDVVRVVSIGAPVQDLLNNPERADWRKFSIEFCGGTHLPATGDIEKFALIAEESVAKGVRRVVGITGASAALADEVGSQLVAKARELTTADGDALTDGIAFLQGAVTSSTIPLRQRNAIRAIVADLQKRAKAQDKLAAAAGANELNAEIDRLLATATTHGETTIFITTLPDAPIEQLKTAADRVKQKSGSAAVLFGIASEGKAILLAAVSNDLIKRGIRAGDWVKQVAPLVDGGGGGPPTMAQAGGKSPEKLPAALDAGRAWITEKLG